MNRLRRLPFAAMALVAVCAALSTFAQDTGLIGLNATLSGVAEVPPNNSGAKGTFHATLDRNRNILRWQIDYADLSAPATAAHFHGPALAGENASAVVTIDSQVSAGETTLTAVQSKELLGGKWYINVHTASYPDGEIRGQVLPQK